MKETSEPIVQIVITKNEADLGAPRYKIAFMSEKQVEDVVYAEDHLAAIAYLREHIETLQPL